MEEDDYSSSGEAKYLRNAQPFNHSRGERYGHGYYDSDDARKKKKYSGNTSGRGSNSSQMICTSKAELSELLDDKLGPINKKITNIERNFSAHKLTTLEPKVRFLELENTKLKDQLNQMDTFSRRSNIRFYGIEEKQGENCESLILESLSELFPDFDSRTFERVHRLGSKRQDETRPIIAKVFHFKDKLLILEKRDQIGILNIKISDDFNKAVEATRRSLLPYVREARANGLKPKLIGERLLLDGKSYTNTQLHKLPDNLRPEAISTKTKDNITAFFTKDSPLSNFYPCKFKVEGQSYNCGEQFLTVAKAKMFGDKNKVAELLKIKEPKDQKKVGYTVNNYRHERWIQQSEQTVTIGIYEKFAQNDYLRSFLLKTGDNLLVEASTDKIWGCGLTLRDPLIWDQQNYTGENRLGNILMCIRDKLKGQK